MAWSVPAIAAAASVPAYAASACAASLQGPAAGNYVLGIPYEAREEATHTDQSFHFYGWINLSGLPADAQITDIRYEYWIQQREESASTDGVPGASGPGVFDPGHSTSDLQGSCQISYSDVGSCSYSGLEGPLSQPTAGTRPPNGGVASPIFTQGSSKAGVTQAWQDHTFRLRDDRSVIAKAWQFTFQGDVQIANQRLQADPTTGCRSLPKEEATPQFNVHYKELLFPRTPCVPSIWTAPPTSPTPRAGRPSGWSITGPTPISAIPRRHKTA